MSSDILDCLDLHNDLSSSKFIVAKELNGCDSSFITSCVLRHYVKNKKNVLVILTHNSFMHYENIGLKMNYNLKNSVESGLVKFYNAGNEIVNILLADRQFSSQFFVHEIENILVSMNKEHSPVSVIFEGVSHLFDLQFSMKEINDILKAILDIIRKYDNALLLCHCNVANENDITHVLANLLCHQADTILEVESLSSGWSAEVSGHITVKQPSQKFSEHNMFALEQKSNQYLFKLFDRGVKLLAPGTV